MAEEKGWHESVRILRLGVRHLKEDTVPIGEMPDAAAQVRQIERDLADIRRGWNADQLAAARDPESEYGPATFPSERGAYGTVQPQVVGSEYRTVTQRTAKRTYNTAAILNGLATALTKVRPDEPPTTPVGALLWAVGQGVATVGWRWASLNHWARSFGLPLKVVKHPIADDGDLDGPWVGEDWRTQVKQEAITATDVPKEDKA